MSVRRILALAALEFRLLLRNGENLLVTLALPIGTLVFFSLVTVVPTGEGTRIDFLVPGVLTLSVMGSAMVGLSIATGFERSYLVLKRLGGTPLRRVELVLAKAIATMLILVVQVVVIAVLALALGWSSDASSWGLAAVSLAVGAIAFAGIGLALAGRLPALGTLAIVNAVFVFLLAISGLLFPLERLPEPLAAIARLLPASALAEVLRAFLEPAAMFPTIPALVLGLWAITMPLLAAWLFRWE